MSSSFRAFFLFLGFLFPLSSVAWSQSLEQIDLSKDGQILGLLLRLPAVYPVDLSVGGQFRLQGVRIFLPQGTLRLHTNGQIDVESLQGDFHLTYDAQGRLSALGEISLVYDEQGRVKSVGSLVFRWTWDNQIEMIGTLALQRLLDQRLSSVGSFSFSFDSYGRIASLGGKKIRFSPVGRLLSIQGCAFEYDTRTGYLVKVSKTPHDLRIVIHWSPAISSTLWKTPSL